MYEYAITDLNNLGALSVITENIIAMVKLRLGTTTCVKVVLCTCGSHDVCACTHTHNHFRLNESVDIVPELMSLGLHQLYQHNFECNNQA